MPAARVKRWMWVGIAVCLVAAASAHTPTVAQDTGTNERRYRTSIEGVTDSGLRRLLTGLSALIEAEDAPFVSFATLRSRANRDLADFRTALRSEGYYASDLSSRIERADDPARVIITIDPGPRYVLGAIDIAYAGTAPAPSVRDQVLDRVGLSAGAAARAPDIVRAETGVALALPELGHPLARVLDRRVVVDHATATVAVTYRMDAGPMLRFGPVHFSGLDTVAAGYLERLVPWQAGQVYDQRLVDRYRQRLSRSGLFSAIDVALDEVETGATGDGVPVLVTVREARHRTIGVGASYSTSEGIGGDVAWEHRNILGSGERLRLEGRGAKIEQSLAARFSKPHFRRYDQTLSAATVLTRQDTDAFRELSSNLSIGLDRPWFDRWRASLAVEAEYSDITDAEGNRQFFLAGLPGSLLWNGTDDLLDPKRGARVLLEVSPYLAQEDSPFGFVRNELTATGYYAPGRDDRLVLALRGKVGSIVGAETTTLPANRRFYAGGGGSVRGFGFQEVGPLNDEGDPAGGRSLAEVGIEARWRIAGNFGLVPFIDGGNVYDHVLPRLSGFRWGGGLGFRYYTAFGPLRFDVATPIDRRPEDEDILFYISIGQSF